jgi:DNA-binding MarR family transcriptional regulator
MAKHSPQTPRREGVQQRVSKHRLTDLQQSLLQWLRTELRRRQRAHDPAGITFPEVVRALRADKVSVTTGLRHLMRKGLVETVLPRGSWVRHVSLTELGEAHARTLSHDARQQHAEVDGGRREGRRWRRAAERHKEKRRMLRRGTHRWSY